MPKGDEKNWAACPLNGHLVKFKMAELGHLVKFKMAELFNRSSDLAVEGANQLEIDRR